MKCFALGHLVDGTIAVVEGALSFHLVVHKTALVSRCFKELMHADAVSFVSFPLATVFLPVRVDHNALAVHAVVHPFTFVHIAGTIFHNTGSMSLASLCENARSDLSYC